MAKEVQGKIANLALPQKARLIALNSVIIPSLSYPLVATSFPAANIKKYEGIISAMYCNALGLNSHFPRALLHGSTFLGGIGIPT
jgi:hypothetical protein